jgi:hypothetical protein
MPVSTKANAMIKSKKTRRYIIEKTSKIFNKKDMQEHPLLTSRLQLS